MLRFEPCCRNNWHIHNADKGGDRYLLCRRIWLVSGNRQAGTGSETRNVVNIKPGVKHWHGSAEGQLVCTSFCRRSRENASTEWLEPVPDDEYGKLG